MTLTPPRFHIADDMPMSLGKAIAREIAPKVDPNAWFDAVGRECPDDKPPKAAPKASIKDLEQEAFERWLSRVCPSGDVESVQSQWLASSDYEDFLAEQEPAIQEPKAEDGWIEWKGGKRPVPPMTEIEVKYGDGQPDGCRTHGTANSWTQGWANNGGNRKNDIVAYRVVKP